MHKGQQHSPEFIKIEPQVCNKEKVEVLLNVGNQDEHILCFKVLAGDLEFIMINLYCQHSLPLERFLQDLISGFPTEKILVTMDSNAKSPLWYSDTTDENGTKLKQFILENNLSILNRPDNPPTYMSARSIQH